MLNIPTTIFMPKRSIHKQAAYGLHEITQAFSLTMTSPRHLMNLMTMSTFFEMHECFRRIRSVKIEIFLYFTE